jgi:hypothetical protein
MKYPEWTRGCGSGIAAAIGLSLLCGTAAAQVHYSYAQPPAAQTAPSATVTESRDALGRSPSTQVTEKRSETGGKQVTTRSYQNSSAGGGGTPSSAGESEDETLRVDAQTVRTVHRDYATDSNGHRRVVSVTEEEKRSLPDGRQSVIRTLSQPDLNNGFQVVRRDLEESKPAGSGAVETRTTVLMPGLEQGLAPHEQIVKVEKVQGEAQKVHTTHLLSDGNGGWQINKVEDKVVTPASKDARTVEERVYQRDAQQNLSVAKAVVTKEWKDPAGQEQQLVETYLTNTPGSTISGDSHLSLDARLHVVRRTSPDGSQQIDEQREEHDTNAPAGEFRTTERTTQTSAPDRDGAVRRQGTVQAFDGNGNMRVLRVFETRPLKP